MGRIKWYSVVVVLALWLVATPVTGSNDGAFSARVQFEQIELSELDGDDISFRYNELSARMAWQFLFIDLDHREYDWLNNPGINATSTPYPRETLTRIAPGFQYYREFLHSWGVWFKFVAIAGFEDMVSSRSWTHNPQLIGFYTMPMRQMKLYGGVGSLHHPVYSITYPVFGVTWNTGAQLGLSAAAGFPETMIRYSFSEQVAIKADFQWDIRIYHLSRSNSPSSGGYMKTEDIKPGLQIEYAPITDITLRFGVRLYSMRSLTIFDDRKRELTYQRVSTSPVFLLGVDYQY